MKYRSITPLYERQRHPENLHVIQLNVSATLAEHKGVNVSKRECTAISPPEKMGGGVVPLAKQE